MIPPIGHGRKPHNAVIKPMPAPLDVIAVVSNPVRYRSRYDLFRAFEAHAIESGARLTIVEMAFGGRPFEITETDNARHVRVRSSAELWHKENLVNIGISRLPSDWRYVAWIDADLTFARPDWVQETLQQLQHYDVVQMFSQAHDIGPNHEVFGTYAGFVWCYLNKIAPKWVDAYHRKGADWHPGYAWAARREAIDGLGGLIDTAILGAGDRHMAAGLIGQMAKTIDPRLNKRYGELLLHWQERAETIIKRNIGFVEGSVIHHWHGPKAARGYMDRWKILIDHQYNPDTDIKRDSQGLYQLSGRLDARSIGLRDDIRAYFRSRNEDGTNLI